MLDYWRPNVWRRSNIKLILARVYWDASTRSSISIIRYISTMSIPCTYESTIIWFLRKNFLPFCLHSLKAHLGSRPILVENFHRGTNGASEQFNIKMWTFFLCLPLIDMIDRLQSFTKDSIALVKCVLSERYCLWSPTSLKISTFLCSLWAAEPIYLLVLCIAQPKVIRDTGTYMSLCSLRRYPTLQKRDVEPFLV